MASLESFVYFGTSKLSADILRQIHKAGLVPELVVTTKAKPSGRGLKIEPTPVATVCKELGLVVLEVANLKTTETLERLKQSPTSWALLAAFGKIVPPEILNLYPKGIINVHPSLLPRHRGASPIQYAILNGDAETGVSLMLLDEEMDHGSIIAQTKCAIVADEDAEKLSDKLVDMAVALVTEKIPAYFAGNIQVVPQDHTKATFTRKITREDGQTDFSKSAEELDRQRRAFYPWPGLWTVWQGKRLKLISTTVLAGSDETGRVSIQDGSLTVGCGQGLLQIHSLQLEGGKTLTAEEFLRGHQTFINSKLG